VEGGTKVLLLCFIVFTVVVINIIIIVIWCRCYDYFSQESKIFLNTGGQTNTLMNDYVLAPYSSCRPHSKPRVSYILLHCYSLSPQTRSRWRRNKTGNVRAAVNWGAFV